MARLADRAGYDAVWVGDSIVAKPRLEPLTTLAYLAGITTRVTARDGGPAAGAAPPGRARPPDRQRRPDLARTRGPRTRRGLEPAVGRARVGGVRRRSQASRAAPGGACRALADALARRAGDPSRRRRRTDRSHHRTAAVESRPGPPCSSPRPTAARCSPPSSTASAGSATASSRPTCTPRSAGWCASAPRRRWPVTDAPGPPFALCVYTTVRLDDDPRTAERVTERVPGDLLRRRCALTRYDGARSRRRGRRCARTVCRGRGQRPLHPVRRRRSARPVRAVHRRGLARPAQPIEKSARS